MHRSCFMKLFFVAGIAILVSLVLLSASNLASNEFDAAALSAVSSFAEPPHVRLEKKIAAMSVEEKIGQMMMVAIPGTVVASTTYAWFQTHHIGGVILVGNNVSSKTQVMQLIRDIQRDARTPNDPKLFIAADQEGGKVSRFLFLNELTGQQDITNADQALAVARARGRELKEMGVNINFSPVLDIASSSQDFISSRTFRGDATQVTSLGTAMLRGYREAGIIATAKHFPGHGGTSVDSHKKLPTVSRDARDLELAFLPFRKAIEEDVPIVMVGHIKIPQIDPDYPATLSSFAIGVLRDEMQYRGVIITDDLGMGAITASYAIADAATRSIQAGADIVLVVRNIADYNNIYKALRTSVMRGDISETRINQSVKRILLLKERFLMKDF